MNKSNKLECKEGKERNPETGRCRKICEKTKKEILNRYMFKITIKKITKIIKSLNQNGR